MKKLYNYQVVIPVVEREHARYVQRILKQKHNHRSRIIKVPVRTTLASRENPYICDLPNCPRIATLTIDTPKQKNVPICEKCFKKVNAVAGVLQK